MNVVKWFFMSGRRKLLYQIECAKDNKQRLHLSNGITLDFTDKGWTNVACQQLNDSLMEVGKYYFVTRMFPTGNSSVELIKCDRHYSVPEFTRAICECDIVPYSYSEVD